MGTRHRETAEPPRIVSLVPSITELLFDLDLGAHVVGRTTFCVHPRTRVVDVPRVGGTKTVRIERLRELRPTHVVVNVDENRREDVAEIERFAPVIVTHPLEPADNLPLYALLGGVFGRSRQAAALSRALAVQLEQAARDASALPSRRVLYLIWKSPWMTVSEPTYISRMLRLVNWRTLGHDPQTRYPEVTLSPDLLGETDLILLASEPFPFQRKHLEALAAELSGGPRLSLIDGEYVSWYGSRAIAGLQYLRELARELAR